MGDAADDAEYYFLTHGHEEFEVPCETPKTCRNCGRKGLIWIWTPGFSRSNYTLGYPGIRTRHSCVTKKEKDNARTFR